VDYPQEAVEDLGKQGSREGGVGKSKFEKTIREIAEGLRRSKIEYEKRIDARQNVAKKQAR